MNTNIKIFNTTTDVNLDRNGNGNVSFSIEFAVLPQEHEVVQEKATPPPSTFGKAKLIDLLTESEADSIVINQRFSVLAIDLNIEVCKLTLEQLNKIGLYLIRTETMPDHLLISSETITLLTRRAQSRKLSIY